MKDQLVYLGTGISIINDVEVQFQVRLSCRHVVSDKLNV